MRTTLDVNEQLLKDIAKITGERSKSKAVNKALSEYVRKVKIEQLKNLSGKVKIIDNWKNWREM
ncbi:type II toxin-antitoxin system VapB family antitoxin [Candidatus Aerophobetes bacterium]|nr:type II toxin-antitoxin system VapB family antitoxin [Candidatus Aerophobetes bacterium]